MTYPEKAAINENEPGVPKQASSPATNRISDGKRSASDEIFFQNALEDDEVREALRALRGTGLSARSRKRA